MRRVKTNYPRLLVKKTARHIYAELIDSTGKVLATANDRKIKEKIRPLEKAKLVGELLAKRAKAAKVERCVFDRRQYRFHGRVAALVNAARKGGLKI